MTRFQTWKWTQNLEGWLSKYSNKCYNAEKEGIKNLLTFEEYLYKAFEADLISFEEVSVRGYHLSRINDQGNYTVENCRFLWFTENHKERDRSYYIDRTEIAKNMIGHKRTQGEKHGRAKLTNEQVIRIFYDPRTFEEISLDYPASLWTICHIKDKSIWKSVVSNL